MRYLSIFAALLFIYGCSGSGTGLTPEQEILIPPGANRVVITSSGAPADIFEQLVQTLETQGYEILQKNDGLRTVRTRVTKLNRRLLVQYQMQVVVEGSGSRVFSVGEWVRDSSMNELGAAFSNAPSLGEDGQEIMWGESIERQAFAEMIRLLELLPHDQMSYETDQ